MPGAVRVGVVGKGRASDAARAALVRLGGAEPVARPPWDAVIALGAGAGEQPLVRDLVGGGLPALVSPAGARGLPGGPRALVFRPALWQPGLVDLRRRIAPGDAPVSAWLRVVVPGGIPRAEAALGGRLEAALGLALGALAAGGVSVGATRTRRVVLGDGAERLRVGFAAGRDRYGEVELVPTRTGGEAGALLTVDAPVGTFAWRRYRDAERLRLQRRVPDPASGHNVARGRYDGEPLREAIRALVALVRGEPAVVWGLPHERGLRVLLSRALEQLAEGRPWPADGGDFVLVQLPRLRRYGDTLRLPSLGLARLAGALRADGVPVRAVDLDAAAWRDGISVEPLGAPADVDAALDAEAPPAALVALVDALAARLPLVGAAAVGFSVVDREGAAHLSLARLLARRVKAARPDLLVVLGGVTDELFAERTLAEERAVDLVVEEDGEVAARRIVEARHLGLGGLANAPNVVLRRASGGGVGESASQLGTWRAPQRTVRLDERACPDFADAPLAAYRRGISPGLGAALAEAGEAAPPGDEPRFYLPYAFVLGCLGQCTFCGFGDRVDLQDEDRTLRDLATLVERHGCRDFVFLNTTVNLSPRRLERLCDALTAADLDLRWTDSARPHGVTPRLAEKLRRAGCVMLSFGVESGSDRVLAHMGKGFRREDVEATLDAVHGAGILTRVNLIAGYLHERAEDVAATVALVESRHRSIDCIGCFNGFQLLPTAGFDEQAHAIRLLGFEDTIDPDQRSLAYDELERDGILGLPWVEKREQIARARAAVLGAIRAHGVWYGAVVDEYDLFWLSRRYEDADRVRRFLLRADAERATLAQRGDRDHD